MRHLVLAPGWAALALAALVACGSSPEDLVEDLADPERQEGARQELLLAKERALEPLLAALADPGLAGARGELVEVLVSLMMRVEDERLPAALGDCLRRDADAGVRARVAHLAGMHRRVELADALLAALDDESGEVRHEALLALNGVEARLSDPQQQRLHSHQADFLHDPHPGVRLEALIRAEREVDRLLADAERAVLEARLADADSLYRHTVATHPYSQRARYREARYHYDSGQTDKGLARLRAAGLLLDVPRLPRAPRIDGLLDDEAWRAAARAGSFFAYSHAHHAALTSEHAAELWAGYTDEALYIGFRGQDEQTDSLVARFTSDMAAAADSYGGGPVTQQNTIWTDDLIELFLDADFDHRDYGHMGINSNGVRVDEWIRGPLREFQTGDSYPDWADAAWRADDEVAARVGNDHWSVEYRLRFGGHEFPRPRPGAVWGFNLVRVYRGQEYSQWVRTYGGGHSPDDFGVLRFQ